MIADLQIDSIPCITCIPCLHRVYTTDNLGIVRTMLYDVLEILNLIRINNLSTKVPNHFHQYKTYTHCLPSFVIKLPIMTYLFGNVSPWRIESVKEGQLFPNLKLRMVHVTTTNESNERKILHLSLDDETIALLKRRIYGINFDTPTDLLDRWEEIF